MSSLWAEDQGGLDRESRVSICVNVSLDSHTTDKPNRTQSWALYPSALSTPHHFQTGPWEHTQCCQIYPYSTAPVLWEGNTGVGGSRLTWVALGPPKRKRQKQG